MSAPFVAGLRTRRGVIRLVRPGDETITIRVQLPDVWDVVRLDVSPHESVLAVKRAALAEFEPNGDPASYVIKLRGFEVLDEQLTVRDAGAVNGSIFLLAFRRRRPVR
ncbi:MAG TPA: hypothetical protein VJ803_09485 [Gemmatimonadaceae bacterium]|nr:hypothetical protein [Gemmatimonadaceae bacterium]